MIVENKVERTLHMVKHVKLLQKTLSLLSMLAACKLGMP